MPRLPLFKEFFKGKTTLTLTNECLTHKKSGISSLSKFKLATRTRYRTVSTAFHNKTTSTESTNEDVTTNNFDLPRCLPTVDNIGTSLELNFDQQESQSSNQASALGPILSKSTEAEFSHIYGIHESDPALSQAQNQSGEDAEGQRFPSKLRKVDAQRLCSIVLLPQESSQAFTPDRASSVDTSTRCTAVPAVVTLPQTPSTEESVEEVCESDEVTVTPASTVVVVHTSSDTSLGNNNSGVISALDEKMPRLPMVQVSHWSLKVLLVFSMLTISLGSYFTSRSRGEESRLCSSQYLSCAHGD